MRFNFTLLLMLTVFSIFGQTRVPLKTTIKLSNDQPVANETITLHCIKNNDYVTGLTDENGKLEVKVHPNSKYLVYYQDYEYKRLPKIPQYGLDTKKFHVVIDEFLFADVSIVVKSSRTNELVPGVGFICKNLVSGKTLESISDKDGKAHFYLPRNQRYTFERINGEIVGTHFIKKAESYSFYSYKIPYQFYTDSDLSILEEEQEAYRIRYEKYLDSLTAIANKTPHHTRIYLNSPSGIGDQVLDTYTIYFSADKKEKLGEVNYIWNAPSIEGKDYHLCNGSFNDDSINFKTSFFTDILPGKHRVYIENKDGTIKQEAEFIVKPDLTDKSEKEAKSKIEF